MYSKLQCIKVVNNLSKSTGFPFPKNKVSYKTVNTDEYWGYDPKMKEINIWIHKNKKDKHIVNGRMYYSIAHEYGHSILDFVLKNNITKENVGLLTKLDYKKMLYQYFGTYKINPSEKDLKNFKHTVTNAFALDEKYRNVLLFDDKYYIPSVIDKTMYANNLTEIFANIFAMEQIKGLMESTNTLNDFKVGIADKFMYSTFHIQYNRDTRTKNEIYKQINALYVWENGFKPESEIFNEIHLNTLNFDVFYQDMNAKLNEMKMAVINFKDIYPTKRDLYFINAENKKENQKIEYSKLQIQQLVDTDSRVSIIDNFKPHIDDKFFKIEQENIYSLASLARANLCNIHPPVCEVIIDTEKCILYCFQEPHHIITTTELEEEVLSDSEITSLCDIVEENKRGKVQEQNSDRNDGR